MLILRALAPCVLAASPVFAQAGPIRITADLPGPFLDISATGLPLNLALDGEVDFVSTTGNAVLPAGPIRIGVNGGLRVGASVGAIDQNLVGNNRPVPSFTAFGARLALLPYWDQLDPTGGQVFVQELGGLLVVQWHEMRVAGGAPGDRVTFQVQIPATGHVAARYVYRTVSAGLADGGRSASIGFQGGPLFNSVHLTMNAPDAVRDGTVLSIVDASPGPVFVDDVPGTFIDISVGHPALVMINNGAALVPTNVRNALVTQPLVRVGENGGVCLATGGNTLAALNEALPSAAAFSGNLALLPFWDDLQQGADPRRVYALELPDRFVVQWNDLGFTGSATGRATFQLQLFHRRSVAAQFLYRDVEGVRADRGSSATIGFQPGGGASAVLHGFNAPSVSDGMVLSLLAFADEVGANYCDAQPNSTGVASVMSGSGSASLSAGDLVLRAEHMPLNSLSFFLVGTAPTFVAGAGGSQGNICVGGNVGRVVGGAVLSSTFLGAVTTQVDLSVLPAPNGVFAAQPGDLLNFQCWYRDTTPSGATSNLSDGLQIQVLP